MPDRKIDEFIETIVETTPTPPAKFNMKKIIDDYNAKRGWRELGKWFFSIATFGLGALYLWATTVVVKQGELGLREKANGDLEILPPGRHSNFPFESYPEKPKSIAEDVVELGFYKIITVNENRVGAINQSGRQVILEPGKYFISDPSDVFKGIVSTQQLSLELKEISFMTASNISVKTQADVSYSIIEPSLIIGKMLDIRTFVTQTVQNAITAVLSGFSIFNVAGASDDNMAINWSSTNSQIQQLVAKNLRERGVELHYLGIEEWTTSDPSTAKELANTTISIAQANSNLVIAKTQAKILDIETTAKITAKRELSNNKLGLDENRLKRLIGVIKNEFPDEKIAANVFQAFMQCSIFKHSKNTSVFLDTPTVNPNFSINSN